MRPLGEVIGFLAPGSPSSFPPGCSRISAAVPDHPETVGSSTRAVAPLQSAPSLARRTSLSGAFLGVLFPLRDINLAHRSAGFPLPAASVLGVSHALDGFIRAWPCGFVAPRSHVQGSPFRGFPSRAVVPPRRWPCPHAVAPSLAATGLTRWRHECRPPTSGLYSTREPVVPTAGV
jgi:hypothetical protein